MDDFTRWMRAAFDDAELEAINAPTSLRALAIEPDERSCLVELADGSLAWRGSTDPIDTWQERVFAAARACDPFQQWTLVDTVACFRGLLDRTHAPDAAALPAGLPAIERSAVRRARGADERATLDAALAEDRLEAWLAAPVGRLRRVNRYLHELWLGRPDLHGVFPRVSDNDATTSGFLEWVIEHGIHEHDIPEACIPSREQAALRVHSESPAHSGVRVVGHGDATHGVGESARQVIRALEHGGELARDWLDPRSADLDVNLLCLNVSDIDSFARDIGPAFEANRYTVAMPYWEIDGPPPGLHDAIRHIDEFWVASEFIADAIRPHVDVPVTVVPLAAREPATTIGSAPGRPFTFGFVFDFNSTIERKQPHRLVEAYRRAFPDQDGSTALVLKSINADLHERDRRIVLDAIGDRIDIELRDGFVPLTERDALVESLDCYVSLHRSEGFGLTIAEALLAHVPVIATGFGANVEFAGDVRCDLVDFTLVDVDLVEGPYAGASGRWAEPSIEHAARLMNAIQRDPADARARAARAAYDLRAELSIDASASAMVARLAEIRSTRGRLPRT